MGPVHWTHKLIAPAMDPGTDDGVLDVRQQQAIRSRISHTIQFLRFM
ncbi:hypothetical protein [Lyngbya confervoides]|uniref:Uncharacterized protein n=1 Tax=Lyngbya confervoides BDU141951 TaxID=1574623 RepID=A0ABD4SZA7_9CYAN|nr:hypothetical protein [Lyngbya confervoides]MCM1981729.1 hypothetical protein [Lyngbya confervoides BDU141951]